MTNGLSDCCEQNKMADGASSCHQILGTSPKKRNRARERERECWESSDYSRLDCWLLQSDCASHIRCWRLISHRLALAAAWAVLGWAGSRLWVTFRAHPMQLWPQKQPNTHPVSNYTHSSALSWDCTVGVTRAALAEIKEHWCVCIRKDLSHWAEGEFQIQTWPIRCLTVKQPPLPKHAHTLPFPPHSHPVPSITHLMTILGMKIVINLLVISATIITKDHPSSICCLRLNKTKKHTHFSFREICVCFFSESEICWCLCYLRADVIARVRKPVLLFEPWCRKLLHCEDIRDCVVFLLTLICRTVRAWTCLKKGGVLWCV